LFTFGGGGDLGERVRMVGSRSVRQAASIAAAAAGSAERLDALIAGPCR
jgi:hypothetical protein